MPKGDHDLLQNHCSSRHIAAFPQGIQIRFYLVHHISSETLLAVVAHEDDSEWEPFSLSVRKWYACGINPSRDGKRSQVVLLWIIGQGMNSRFSCYEFGRSAVCPNRKQVLKDNSFMWDFVLYQANPHTNEYVFLRILSSNSIRNLVGGKSRTASAAYTIIKGCDNKTIRESKIKAINQISSFCYVVETSVAYKLTIWCCWSNGD